LYSQTAPDSHIPNGSNPFAISGAGQTTHVTIPIIETGNPNFNNYAYVNVGSILDAAFPEPEITQPVSTPIAGSGIGKAIPDESWWYAGLKAGVGTFIHGAGTMAYDFANHVSVGSIDSERYNDQVNAQGERLYNVAKNLGYSDASIANGYGLAQAVAGEAFGTNALAEAGTGYDLGTNTTLDGWERAQKAAQGTAQVAGTLAGAFKATGVNPRLTGTKKSFMEMMSQEDATRYQKYWNDAKLKQYTPGIRELHRTQVSKDGRYTYDTVSHFDEYGRLIGETHFSTHPSTPLIHPNPHHHKIIYSSEFPLGRKLKQILEGTYEP
jgi:hypothetical protein